MKKIKYNGHKYSGVVLCPMYSDTQFILPQHQEFAEVLIKTLLTNRILKLKRNIPIQYKVSSFNEVYGRLTIRYGRRKLKFLFVRISIIYPDIEEICQWNSRAQTLFEEDGIYGMYGLKDESLIKYSIDTVKNSIFYGEDKLPTVIDKAAYLWIRIARYQAFQNGNKRTGLLTGLIFLGMNQFIWKTNKDKNSKLYDISKSIALDKVPHEVLVGYIRENVIFNLKFMRTIYDNIIDR